MGYFCRFIFLFKGLHNWDWMFDILYFWYVFVILWDWSWCLCNIVVFKGIFFFCQKFNHWMIDLQQVIFWDWDKFWVWILTTLNLFLCITWGAWYKTKIKWCQFRNVREHSEQSTEIKERTFLCILHYLFQASLKITLSQQIVIPLFLLKVLH